MEVKVKVRKIKPVIGVRNYCPTHTPKSTWCVFL